jgi:hypothetical protein
MEIVPFLIDMSVGVSEGRMAVAGIGVDVTGTGVKVGGEAVAVGKTSNEKVQALSSSAPNMKMIIDGNHLCSFIASSLFDAGIPNRVGYKTFVSDLLFHSRSGRFETKFVCTLFIIELL